MPPTPALLGRLAGAELAFVVDPIDGTSNYVAGLPLFGVMAAAVVAGEVVAGAILDPVLDDTAVALRGWRGLDVGARCRTHPSGCRCTGAPGEDERVRVLAVHARADARDGLAQHAGTRRRVRLPLCRP